ncbi:uncharacterized protein [Amphiura filiformis]|uniref:uncharacterized protein isoform X2 n=1 Tax=Amphiura filiformis TaxID=82378 RepID=UPI003B213A02
MEYRCLYALVAFVATTQVIVANHFRGGSMSWRPLPQVPDQPQQVEVTYRMGYRYDFREPGHDRCTPEAYLLRQQLETNGELICKSCGEGNRGNRPDVKLSDLSYYCDDFDVTDNWATGSNKIIVDVPANGRKREFDVSYQDCCWLRPLASHPVSGRGWKMFTHVNVKPRPDNGLINSSPLTSPIPVQVFQQGCHYNLQIPVSDPENDVTRCRIASRIKGECNSVHDKVCGETPYVTVHENCTLNFDTSGEAGYYAVTVIIEDFIDESSEDPLSSVSLLFLLRVDPSNSCTKPITISPPHGTCKTIPANEPFNMDVIVEAGDPRKPVSKITTIKPPGMHTSDLRPVFGYPDRKAITLFWTPSDDMVGRHTVCYSAIDSDSFSSGMTCIILNVANVDALEPQTDISTPADGGSITVGEKWTIEFNTEVQRPTTTSYITLVDERGYGVLNLDTSEGSNDVEFNGRKIEFYPPEDTFPVGPEEAREYRLRLDQGAAVSVGSCGLDSEAYEWNFEVVGRKLPATLPPPTRKAPEKYVAPRSAIPQCFSSSMEIFVSKAIVGEVDPSIIHLNDPACKASYYNATHYVIGTPYGLCGTTVEIDQEDKGGRQIIQNIVYIPAQPYTNDSIITRDDNIEIHVTCNLTTKRYTHAEFDPDVQTIIYYEAGYGNFNFTLRMLHDDQFTIPFTLRDFPVDVDLNQRMYFEARSWAKANMELQLSSCRATPTSNPFDPVQYTFIRNGCGLDDTVEFHESGNMLRKRFSVSAFAFLGKHMHGSVFVHCDMRLCDSNDPNSRCAQGCASDPTPGPTLSSTIIQKRDVSVHKRDVSIGRRDVSDGEGLASTEAYQETDGPIRIVQDGDSDVPIDFEYDQFNWDLLEVVLISAVILLLVCLIIVQLFDCGKKPTIYKSIPVV